MIGRTKPDSIELDPKPETSHVARTDQDDFGHILRRNTAYGTVSDHGTVFVGFACTRRRCRRCSRAWLGVDGPRDALTRYTTRSPAATTGCRRRRTCSRSRPQAECQLNGLRLPLVKFNRSLDG